MAYRKGGGRRMGHLYNKQMVELQPDLVLDQANPGDGVEYPLLVPTNNVRIISIACSCTWTVQPNPLEARLIVDGNTLNHPQGNPVSARMYIPQFLAFAAEGAGSLADSTVFDPTVNRPFFTEGLNIGVGFEVTGGTVQNLDARIKWGILRDTI